MTPDAGQSGSGAATTEEVVQGETRATSADSRNELRALYSLGSIQSPAEVFADFASKVGDVQKTTQGDATVYSGKLTAQGAQSLGRKVSVAHDEAGTDGHASGTYSVTVKDGAATEAVFVLARTGRDGERTIAELSKHMYTIERVGDSRSRCRPKSSSSSSSLRGSRLLALFTSRGKLPREDRTDRLLSVAPWFGALESPHRFAVRSTCQSTQQTPRASAGQLASPRLPRNPQCSAHSLVSCWLLPLSSTADAASELQAAVTKIAKAETLRFEVRAENSG
jgi:hypothetical protein